MFVTKAVVRYKLSLCLTVLKRQYLHISEIVYSTNHKGLSLVWRFNIAGNKNKNSELHVKCLIFSRKEKLT